ncbi:hypothetical protein TorRG33x02_312190 [Trema orientale]|uniref:Uncharacterized protein n=1 Tax=Trema orientale TaxID=63057 RepID=A0A2P5BR14_TREOI|nr:hypothetical protein TorRG33x02_312190 [Trema orientale]
MTISCTEKDFIVQSNKDKMIIISCTERVHPLYKKKYELVYNSGMHKRKNNNHDVFACILPNNVSANFNLTLFLKPVVSTSGFLIKSYAFS